MGNVEKVQHYASIIQAIENIYNKAKSVGLFNGSTRDWFRTTVGVQQECLLYPTLFNIFLQRIMSDALKAPKDSVSIEDRIFINFRFANAEEAEETDDIVNSMDTTCTDTRWRLNLTKQK